MNETIYNLINDAKNQLNADIKIIESKLKSHHDELSSDQKQNFKIMKDTWEKLVEVYNNAMFKISSSHSDSQTELITHLREALENELGGYEKYAVNLLENEEQRLVGLNETSIINVKDITTAHIEQMDHLVKQIEIISDDAISKSIELIKEKDLSIKQELTSTLHFNQGELKGSIVNLQEEFSSKIASQIENVYMGVSKTKTGLNDVIKDTLSRLEENLMRLTRGLDDNFGSEVGKTQDLIHAYETKLHKAIDEMHINYEKQMGEIINKQMDLANKSLSELEVAMNKQKREILGQIANLSKDQRNLVGNAIGQLEGQVSASKSNIIEFMGSLRDQLQNALNENRDSTTNHIKEMHGLTSVSLNKFTTEVKITSQKHKELIKADVENSSVQFDDAIQKNQMKVKRTINQLKDDIKEFDQNMKKDE